MIMRVIADVRMIQSIDNIFTLAPRTAWPKTEPHYLPGSYSSPIFHGNISLARKFPFSNKCKCKMAIPLLTLLRTITKIHHFGILYLWTIRIIGEICIWLWKPVKLIVGVYVMVKISETDDWNVFDATLPLIAHQYRRSWEDPGIVKMLMVMVE